MTKYLGPSERLQTSCFLFFNLNFFSFRGFAERLALCKLMEQPSGNRFREYWQPPKNLLQGFEVIANPLKIFGYRRILATCFADLSEGIDHPL
jgi:hypothetical protein